MKCESASGLDHIPFVVTPAAAHHPSKALVVLPSFTYLAYANVRLDVVHDYPSGRNVEGTIAADRAWRCFAKPRLGKIAVRRSFRRKRMDVCVVEAPPYWMCNPATPIP